MTLSVTGVPSGATASFDSNPVDVPVSLGLHPTDATLTISNIGNVSPGAYPMTLFGVSGVVSNAVDLSLIVFDGIPNAPTLLTPLADETLANVSPLFRWSAVSNATAYEFELSTDAGFVNIVDSSISTATNHVLAARARGRANLPLAR